MCLWKWSLLFLIKIILYKRIRQVSDPVYVEKGFIVWIGFYLCAINIHLIADHITSCRWGKRREMTNFWNRIHHSNEEIRIRTSTLHRAIVSMPSMYSVHKWLVNTCTRKSSCFSLKPKIKRLFSIGPVNVKADTYIFLK